MKAVATSLCNILWLNEAAGLCMTVFISDHFKVVPMSDSQLYYETSCGNQTASQSTDTKGREVIFWLGLFPFIKDPGIEWNRKWKCCRRAGKKCCRRSPAGWEERFYAKSVFHRYWFFQKFSYWQNFPVHLESGLIWLAKIDLTPDGLLYFTYQMLHDVN